MVPPSLLFLGPLSIGCREELGARIKEGLMEPSLLRRPARARHWQRSTGGAAPPGFIGELLTGNTGLPANGPRARPWWWGAVRAWGEEGSVRACAHALAVPSIRCRRAVESLLRNAHAGELRIRSTLHLGGR
eukprot:2351756-Pyramimonas_sp.AAC.1